MKHTLNKNVSRDGDLLTVRTQGTEGTVRIRLSTVRKVKCPFAGMTVETDERTYRLDLRNVEPSEYAEAKAILTDAMKARRRTARDRQPHIVAPAPDG